MNASDTLDSYNTLRTVSTITWVGGGVLLLGGGLVAYLTAPKAADRRASIAPWIGAGSAGVRGAF